MEQERRRTDRDREMKKKMCRGREEKKHIREMKEEDGGWRGKRTK